MELEGFARCQKDLEDDGIDVLSITTDRHLSITKYMREKLKQVKHYYDTWHISKG